MDVGVNAQPGNKDKNKNGPPSHHPRFWTINGNKTGDIDFLGTTNSMPINFKTADTLRMLISPLGDINMFGNLLVNKKITGQAMRLTGLSGNKGMLAVDENGDLFRKDFETDTFVFHNMQTENLKVENNFQIGNTIYANVDPATKNNYIYTDSNEPLYIQYPPSDTVSPGHLILGDSTGNHNVGVKTVSPQYDLDVNGDINFTGLLLKNGEELNVGLFKTREIENPSNGYWPDKVFNKVITTPEPYSQNDYKEYYFHSIGINTETPNARLEIVGKEIYRSDVYYSSNIRFRDIYMDYYGDETNYVWDIKNDEGMLSFHYGEGNNNTNPLTDTKFSINKNGVINHDKQTHIGGRTIIDGKVCIGTHDFDANDGLLNVNGNIIAEDIKVKDVVTADYVFKKDYKLLNIDSLALFIKQNGHLPNIPSADEMKQNGITLAKMNGLLLQKVEELTLYMIELKKENEKLKEQNEKIDVVMMEIEKLKAQIEE